MIERPISPHPPRVPMGHRIYAVGDMHGRRDLLVRLHKKILEDGAGRNELEKTIIYLGDYIDRGENSAGIIELLLEQPLIDFTRIHLKGNHEAFFLKFLSDQWPDEAWLSNGGWATLKSYGLDFAELRNFCDSSYLCLTSWKRNISERIPYAHMDFLNRLQLYHIIGDYLFVHAGIRPGVAMQAQSTHDMLWIREPFLSSQADHGVVVVHGHTVVPEVSISHNRVSIDTGAVTSGHLSCLVLEGEEQRLIQT